MSEEEFQKEFAKVKVEMKKESNLEEKAKLRKKLWELVNNRPAVRMKII